ncbi:hypothetical protein, variant, partial [Verruconis gallopava]
MDEHSCKSYSTRGTEYNNDCSDDHPYYREIDKDRRHVERGRTRSGTSSQSRTRSKEEQRRNRSRESRHFNKPSGVPPPHHWPSMASQGDRPPRRESRHERQEYSLYNGVTYPGSSTESLCTHPTYKPRVPMVSDFIGQDPRTSNPSEIRETARYLAQAGNFDETEVFQRGVRAARRELDILKREVEINRKEQMVGEMSRKLEEKQQELRSQLELMRLVRKIHEPAQHPEAVNLGPRDAETRYGHAQPLPSVLDDFQFPNPHPLSYGNSGAG